MIQPIFNQLKLVVTAFVLTMGIVSSLSMGSISTQAAPVYSCPAGSVLVGANCSTPRKALCSDLSAPDAGGNCSQGQSALFPCDGRPGQYVILEASSAMSNNTKGTTLCSTRTNLFNRTESRSATGCNRTDYMLNPVDGRWMNEYTMLANENNQVRETQYCKNGVRVCPVGQRLFYYPAGTYNRLLPETGIVCVIESFNFRDNGLLPIAYTRNGANTAAECDSSIYDVISIWDWNGGDAEDNRICAKKTYKATAQAGTAVCPVNFTDNGTTCLAPATKTSNSPDGWLDGISNTGIASGWATDADVINTSLDVHFYIDGSTSSMGTYIGKTTASYVRPDLPAPYNTGKNGYDFKLPKAYCDSKPHTLYAYGIDAPSFVSNPLLSGSPKSFTLSETQCGYGTTTTTTITKDPVTLTDLTDGSVKIICNGGKEVIVNSKTTCIFDIGDKTLPDNTNIAIGNGDISSSTCKAVGAAVNCTNVSTGTLTGDQPIFVKVGDSDKTDTNQKVKVADPATISTVSTVATSVTVTSEDFKPKIDNGSGASTNPTIKVTCNDGKDILINSTATCTFDIGNKTLPENTKIAIGSGDITTSNCIVNGSKVTCTNVSTGSEAGDQPLYIKIGNGQKVNTNQKVKVSGDSSVTATLVRSGAGTAVAGTIGTMAMAGAGFFLYKKKTARNAKLNI